MNIELYIYRWWKAVGNVHFRHTNPMGSIHKATMTKMLYGEYTLYTCRTKCRTRNFSIINFVAFGCGIPTMRICMCVWPLYIYIYICQFRFSRSEIKKRKKSSVHECNIFLFNRTIRRPSTTSRTLVVLTTRRSNYFE